MSSGLSPPAPPVQVESDDDDGDRRDAVSRVRLCAGISLAGFALFVLIDRMVAPAQLRTMVEVRAVTGALIGIILAATYTRRAARHTLALSVVLFALVCLSIIVLDAIAGGWASQYHQPLALMFVSYASLMPTTLPIAVPTLASLVAIFAAVMITLGIQGPPSVFASHIAILLLAATISLFFIHVGNLLKGRERQARRSERQARQQLAAQNVELARAADDLKALDRLKSEFFANVNHELRTPLTMVLAHAELARDEAEAKGEGGIARHIEACRRSGSRLMGLVHDMLDLTRLEMGKMRMRRAPVDLPQLCADLVADIRELAGRKQIGLALVLPEAWASAAARPGPLDVDAEQIDRILINLLTNAIKFTGPGGQVSVELEVATAMFLIRVRDTGPGIAPAALPHLFERGFQVPGSQASEGLGIGLHLVRLIAEAHGGHVGVDSVLGEGAVFTVALPLAATGAAT